MLQLRHSLFTCPYLESASLHHDLLSVWLDSCQGEELSLENHRWLLGVQLYCIKLLFAPFHIDWKHKNTHTHKHVGSTTLSGLMYDTATLLTTIETAQSVGLTPKHKVKNTNKIKKKELIRHFRSLDESHCHVETTAVL